MKEYTIKCLVLGMVQTNTYIMSNDITKEAIVFDPADNAKEIDQFLKRNDLVCKGILLTHGHYDHIIAAKELAKLTQVQIHAHEEEVQLLSDPYMNVSKMAACECSLIPDVRLKDGDLVKMAGFTFKVIHTPGHTSGGVCYYDEEHEVLFSGDTLFCGSVGRTDFPTGNGRVLMKSIKERLMKLEDHVIVYPGHGEATTIGFERENNYYITHNLGLDTDL